MPQGAFETAVNLLRAWKLSRRGSLVATKLTVFITRDKAYFITANLPPVLLLFLFFFYFILFLLLFFLGGGGGAGCGVRGEGVRGEV